MNADRIDAPRLVLEPFDERFISPRYVSWLNDPDVTRYSDQRFRTHTEDSCRAYLASFAGTPHGFWAIVARDRTIGHCGNINAYVDEHHGVADVGIVMGERSQQGRGYGTEAWTALCDYLLRTRGLRKVSAGTTSMNTPMLRIMERLGMMPDGTRLRHNVCQGVEVDVVHTALFRDSWIARYPRGPFDQPDLRGVTS